MRVDGTGALVLQLHPVGDRWLAAEVRTPIHRGSPRVQLELSGSLGALDPQVVVGVFLYRTDQREVDVEFSTWGRTRSRNAQFVVAPPSWERMRRFDVDPSATSASVEIAWAEDGIEFGLTAQDARPVRWAYRGRHPARRLPYDLHVNVWLLDGAAPTDGEPVELRVTELRVPTEPPRRVAEVNCDARVG